MSGNFNIEIDIDKFLSRADYKYEHFDKLAEHIEIGINNGIDEFSLRLIDKLIENMGKYNLANSPIIDNVNIDVVDEGIIFKLADGHYAMFVEYGTGIKGAGEPHPWAESDGWKYDVNNHGESGWWYPTVESDENPTKVYSDKIGRWIAWTAGSESRPFMYDTWKWARHSFTNVINYYIRKEVKRWESEVNNDS